MQWGENLIIEYVFKARKFFKVGYLDIGSHHPLNLKNIAKFYQARDSGCNVEANPDLIQVFQTERPNNLNVPCAVGLTSVSAFFLFGDCTSSALGEQERDHLVQCGQKIKCIFQVPVKSINKLIGDHFSLPGPDLLCIDVEGLDLAILQRLDLKKYRPKVICVESVTYSPIGEGKKNAEFVHFMERNRYIEYAFTGLNSIFVEDNFSFVAKRVTRFTIIIPTFEPSDRIITCISSITNQTYDQWEIIIVDYCSKSIHKYSDILLGTPNLIFSNIKTKGIYNAINKGFQLASGDWILVLGHDDKLFNNRVLEKVKHFVHHSSTRIGALYGNVLVNGNTLWARDGETYAGKFSLNRLFQQNICQQAIFYNKTNCHQIPLFNQNYCVCGDWEFNIRLALSFSLVYIPLTIAVFQTGGTSSVRQEADETYRPNYSFKFIYFQLRKNSLSKMISLFKSYKIYRSLRHARNV